MAVNRYPLIAREGWLSIALSGVAAIAILYLFGWLWSLPLWLVVAALLFLFRDPARQVPASPLAVVSPADGRVVAVEPVADPYLEREARRVVIRMRHLGAYSTRAPVEGKILEPRRSGPGRPQGVWLRTDGGDDLVVVMNRGPLRNAPRCYVRFGDRVGQGQRCGFVALGSELEIYLPLASRMKVGVGDRLRAGSDVIAQLVHK